jgi:hypothetical protein
MSHTSISRAATDPDLINRVIAAAHREMVYDQSLADTVYGKQLGNGVIAAQPLMWPIAVDNEAAYESALLAGRGAPGHDVDIITDAALSSAVVTHWPYTDVERNGGGTVTSIEPETAEVGGEDVTLHVRGSGFSKFTVILFNNSEEPTTFVSASEVTTLVRPSTASGPWTVPVTVANGTGTVNFSFTETA